MAHAKMFDDDDPFLARVRELALALPDTAEKVSHGRPAFYTKKVFCYYGGSVKVDGVWIQHPHSIMILPDADELRALADDVRVFVPAYIGPSGWLGVDLDEHTDWTEIAELLDMSLRLTAPKRVIAELDARTAAAEDSGCQRQSMIFRSGERWLPSCRASSDPERPPRRVGRRLFVR